MLHCEIKVQYFMHICMYATTCVTIIIKHKEVIILRQVGVMGRIGRGNNRGENNMNKMLM